MSTRARVIYSSSAQSCWPVTDSAPNARPTREIAAHVGMPVVSLELVDPRFYHLDTALAVLDDTTIAYYPPAFSDEARMQAARAVPRRDRGGQRRRIRARPQRRVRRPERRACPRPPPASPSSCARPDSGRSASICPNCSRAADPSNAARWRYIRDDPGLCDCYRRRDRHRRPLCRPQLLAAAGGRGQRRRRLDHRRRGPPLSGLPGRLLGGQLRAPQPGDHRDRARAARRRDAGQPRLPLRPARHRSAKRWPSSAARTWCCR